MTRRDFCSLLPVSAAAAASKQQLVAVPVRQLIDGAPQVTPGLLRYFWSTLWPETLRDFRSCGIRLDCTVKTVELERPQFREPYLTGLERGAINFVVTDRIPSEWDGGRALSGVTTTYRGYHLCMIALRRAHGHQVPFLSLNTCVHELLHVLMQDVFERRPPGLLGQARELRIDCYATRLWLFGDGGAIRQSAQHYLQRLRQQQVTASQPPSAL